LQDLKVFFLFGAADILSSLGHHKPTAGSFRLAFRSPLFFTLPATFTNSQHEMTVLEPKNWLGIRSAYTSTKRRTKQDDPEPKKDIAMTAITAEELRKLAARQPNPCVSIYMPLHRSQPDSKQDPIRLKNLLDGAENALHSQGMSRGEIVELLEEARSLETNALFWRSNGSKGLALLIEPKSLRTIRSHDEFEEFVAVGQHFHLAPLVHAYSEPERFLVLAVSANNIRLYHADEHSLTPAPLPEAIPKNLHEDEATKGMEFDKGLQYHTSATHGVGSARVGIVHGHGMPKDDQKTLLTEYLRTVMRHLEPVLEKESTPLVLAAVDYVHPIFREVCRYPHLLSDGVNASPDGLTESDLYRQAFEVVKPKLHAKMQAARNRYQMLKTTDRVAFHIEEILRAEDQGRVEVLFAAHGPHVWGTVNAANAVDVHRERKPGDIDLLNLAINQAIAGGGTAYVVDAKDVPSRELAAAILRW